MVRYAVLAVLVLTMSGCGIRERVFGTRAQADRALPFRTSLSKGPDRRDFIVAARRAGGADLASARESLRFAATAYCIKTYGGPEVDWTRDSVGGDWAVLREGDSLVVSGRCTFR